MHQIVTYVLPAQMLAEIDLKFGFARFSVHVILHIY
jgi:hypothetical protein